MAMDCGGSERREPEDTEQEVRRYINQGSGPAEIRGSLGVEVQRYINQGSGLSEMGGSLGLEGARSVSDLITAGKFIKEPVKTFTKELGATAVDATFGPFTPGIAPGHLGLGAYECMTSDSDGDKPPVSRKKYKKD